MPEEVKEMRAKIVNAVGDGEVRVTDLRKRSEFSTFSISDLQKTTTSMICDGVLEYTESLSVRRAR